MQRPQRLALESGHLSEKKGLLEGEKPGADSQRGMMQRMRRMTTRQAKELEQESINILFDATFYIRNFNFILR